VRALFIVSLLIAMTGQAQAPAALEGTPQKKTPDAKPRLAVLKLQPQGVSPDQANAFTDAIVAALTGRGVFEVISSRDVETVLGAERQKQLLGVCDTSPESCGTSIGDALATSFVLSGQLSRVGSAFQLSLTTVDTTKGRAIARSNRISPNLEELQRLIPYAAAEATGSPLPPPPSRVVPISLLAAGGAAFFAGGIYGIITLTQERQLNDELCPGGVPADGRCTGTALRERSFYLEQNDLLSRQKWIAASVMLAGAITATLGFVLMPPPDSQSRLSVLVVPTLGGVSVVGGFW
jgi:TolB-like protein